MEKIVKESIYSAKTVGIGTGKTVNSLIKFLPNDKIYVASSIQSLLLLNEQKLQTSPLSVFSELDIYFDGTDFYDANENLLKGGGGSLVQEKMMLSMSKKSIIFAQKNKKKTNFLDSNVSICVLSEGLGRFSGILHKNNLEFTLRETFGKVGPLITDNGHVIFDVKFNYNFIKECKNITCVIEHGFFEKNEYGYQIFEI